MQWSFVESTKERKFYSDLAKKLEKATTEEVFKPYQTSAIENLVFTSKDNSFGLLNGIVAGEYEVVDDVNAPGGKRFVVQKYSRAYKAVHWYPSKRDPHYVLHANDVFTISEDVVVATDNKGVTTTVRKKKTLVLVCFTGHLNLKGGSAT